MGYIKYILILLFISSHLVRLTALPIFTDETNYLDWGWRETHIPGFAFYSLYDAKQPLAMWLFGWSQSVFSDPLFAGRFVSVWTGLITGLAVYFLGKKLFDDKTGVLAFGLYSFTHYFFFFDRQALVESTMASIFAWTACVLFVLPKLTWKKSVLLGLLFGVGYLTKSNSLLVTLTSILFLVYKHRLEIKNNFGKSFVQLSLMLVVAVLITLPMVLHPWFAQYIHLSTQYTFTIRQLISLPVNQWWKNVTTTSSILFWFLTPVLFLTVIAGVWKSKKFNLFVWILVPLVLQIVMAKFLVSRYLVSYVPLMVVYAAWYIGMQKKLIKYLLLGLIFLPNLYLDMLQLTNPANYFYQLAKLTNHSYIAGYVTTEASGYNLLVARKYFENIAKTQPIILGVAVFSGNPEAGLLVYFRDHPKIHATYLDAMLFGDSLKEAECITFDRPAYLATRDKGGAGLLKYFEPETELRNTFNDSVIYVFKLKTGCQGTTLQLSPS